MQRDALHRLYPLIALGALAAVTLWLERVSRPTAESTPIVASTGPDMIAERIAVHRFDPSGQRQYDLSASAMRHFPSDGHTDLDEPELRFYGTERTTHASAENGSVSKDGNTVRLNGNVLVVREAVAGKPAAEIRTEALIVWPDAQRVESAAPVTYTEGSSTVKAATLTADNLHGNLQLGGGVKATLAR